MTANRDLWQYDEPCAGEVRYLVERFDGYEQEARVLLPEGCDTPSVFVMGGARSDYTRLNPLLYRLQALGLGTLTANLSGHSLASEPGAPDASLKINLEEAQRFYLHPERPCQTLIGHSMGASLALKLAAQHPSIDTLVLICPAIYPDDAHDKPFGPTFSEAIRKPYGFMDCDSFSFLRQFPGRVLLIMGEYDSLNSHRFGQGPGTSAGSLWLAGAQRYSPIPEEVTRALLDVVPPPNLECLLLADCDHSIATHLRSHPEVADLVAQTIVEFVRG